MVPQNIPESRAIAARTSPIVLVELTTVLSITLRPCTVYIGGRYEVHRGEAPTPAKEDPSSALEKAVTRAPMMYKEWSPEKGRDRERR